MYIDRIIFPINTLGPGNRAAIWTVGCERRCKNCSNPELQELNKDNNVDVDTIIDCIRSKKESMDGITLTGGDPFMQPEELRKLVSRIKEEITDDIIIYSGYTIDELKEKNNEDINEVLQLIAVLIDGEYIDELNDGVGIRGSSNQRIHILNDKFKIKYEDAHLCKRTVQNIFYRNNVIHVGIPLKDD